MIKAGDIIECEIEKLVHEGKGLSRIDNFVIFVKNAVPKDIVKVKISKVNKHYGEASVIKILKESPYRKKPECHLFNACGACHLQYIDYDYLLKCKKNIVEETLSMPVRDVIKSPEVIKYRCKTQYPVSETKNSKRIVAGYYREKSHKITNIKYCTAQSDIVNDIIDYIRANWKLGAYVEKTRKGLLRHIIIKQSSSTNEILVILVLNSDKKTETKDFFKLLTENFNDIKGCLVNYNSKNTNRILGDKTELVLGQDYYTEILENKTYKIGAESFFQVNPKCAVNIFNEVKKNIEPDSTVLDCYGGVGAIGVWVSDLDSCVTLIEENENAIQFAEENYKNNGVKNYKIIKGDVKKELSGEYDYAIIDPPRKGCDKEFLEKLVQTSKNIIYVSCNPSTLKRDIDILRNYDFEVQYVQPIDMFPYTYHIECVCILKKI